MSEHRDDIELNRIAQEYARRESSGVGNSYQFSNPAYLFHMQERERALIDFLKRNQINLSECKILEVGCGTGSNLQRFIEFGGKEATGVDFLESRITAGRKKFLQVTLIQSNAAQLPIPSESFDLVMNFMCLSSVLDPNMRKNIASEMWRVTKPGGAVLSYDMRPLFKPLDILSKLYIRNMTAQGKSLPPQTPLYFLDEQDYKKLFPKGTLKYRTLSLLMFLAGFSGISFLLTYFLSRIPVLHTHGLAVIHKPIS